MFGRKKRELERIRRANPNYWMIDEYHQHENEGSCQMPERKTHSREYARESVLNAIAWNRRNAHRQEPERETKMHRDEVEGMRKNKSCKACVSSTCPIGDTPCSDCFFCLSAPRPRWQPSALFLALEEALSVAADKPVEAKAMTAEEATAILRSLWIDRKTDTALTYAIDAIRRDEKATTPDRDTMLFCPDCQKLLVRSTRMEVEKEYVKEKLAALRKVLVGNLAFSETISIRPLLDIINRIKTDA